MLRLPRREPATGPELIHTVARQVRRGRPIDEAIAGALRGDHRARYVNLVADLCGALRLTEPANRWDVDHLPDPTAEWIEDRRDHPASYGERLIIWAARIHDPAVCADQLDRAADTEAAALLDGVVDRSKLGGSAYQGILPRPAAAAVDGWAEQ